MNNLSFKTFTWPQNPTAYREKAVRLPQYAKDVNGNLRFVGLGEKQLEITAEGAFFGAGAFQSFQDLSALMEDETYGILTHPVWGIRYVYFTGLDMTQEPRENYVTYRAVFTGVQLGGESGL